MEKGADDRRSGKNKRSTAGRAGASNTDTPLTELHLEVQHGFRDSTATQQGSNLRKSQHDQSRPRCFHADQGATAIRGSTRMEFVSDYVDEGISGTKDKRPALDRLMADAHKRKFDVVMSGV